MIESRLRSFDRVKAQRLTTKLRAAKVRPEIVAVIESRLRSRPGQIDAGGTQSDKVLSLAVVWPPSGLASCAGSCSVLPPALEPME